LGVSEAIVRQLALSLPEATEEPHFDMASFRVAGKIFATVPAGGDGVHVFLDEADVDGYVADYPDAVEVLWWGRRRSGARVWRSRASRGLMREMLSEAWRRRAPKRLLAALED
jgi:hypothetical protein